jgi:alcohol dehydrogenase YqhD (iron-dependent ADH family)
LQLREKVNSEVISDYVRKLFGKFNPMAEQFISTLHARGQAALQRVVDNLLRFLKGRERRAIHDVAQNVRDFFAGLGDHVRGRYADFAQWLGQVWDNAISQTRDKHTQLREVAHEVIGHAKEMHKQTVREAVEALRPFCEDLGNMWQELLDAARDALKRKE